MGMLAQMQGLVGLGLLLGVTYIFGALSAGPLIRRLRGKFPGLTPRRILAGLMVLAGVLCTLPWLAVRLLAT
jgi:hypothetical protein